MYFLTRLVWGVFCYGFVMVFCLVWFVFCLFRVYDSECKEKGNSVERNKDYALGF